MKTFTTTALALALTLPAGLALAQNNGARATVDRPGHREFAWDGGKSLSVGGAMTVRVRKDGAPRVVVTGPDELVNRVYLSRGRLGVENNNWWGGNFSWNNRRLEVEITGVAPNEVSVSGSSQVTLADPVRERDFEVHISGSGSVNASGQVEQLDVHVSGSGNARLAALEARRGDLSVSGSGRVDVEAVEEAEVGISGSGQVRINGRPRALAQSISGSGQLTAGGQTYSRRTRELERQRERELARAERERERELAREQRERERELDRERRERERERERNDR
jgi:hypothetical protein